MSIPVVTPDDDQPHVTEEDAATEKVAEISEEVKDQASVNTMKSEAPPKKKKILF